MKKIAIIQSNYIPWKGYFDLIAAVDEFIIYDDMQYTRRDWRNRNMIKTPTGPQWLTVPVKAKGKYYQTIRDAEIDSATWAEDHRKALWLNYRRAPHFEEVYALIEPVYCQRQYTHLSVLNRDMIELICNYLQIRTKISNSWDYQLIDGKSERLADLCAQAAGTEYISGPSAKDYIDERVFAERGIKVGWFDNAGYQEYPQLWGEFIHHVTILDLLFNCGRTAPRFMKHVKP